MFKKFGIVRDQAEFEVQHVIPLSYAELSGLCVLSTKKGQYVCISAGPRLLWVNLANGIVIDFYGYQPEDNITQISIFDESVQESKWLIMVKTKLGSLSFFEAVFDASLMKLNLIKITEVKDDLLSGFESIYFTKKFSKDQIIFKIFPLSSLDKGKSNDCTYFYFQANVTKINETLDIKIEKQSVVVSKLYKEETEVKENGPKKDFGKFTKIIDVRNFELNQIRSFDTLT